MDLARLELHQNALDGKNTTPEIAQNKIIKPQTDFLS